MACVEKCTRGMQLYGFRWILLMVCQRFFEDSKLDHIFAKEKKDVCME
jgi:hypothetical protein